MQLRYRLLPYLYTAFWRSSVTGEPVQRPLVFDHQYDATVRDLDDEYLFGPDLLVAPVTVKGATQRQVYLPDGDWYDWHTDEPSPGRRFVLAQTPMHRIPLYAKAGAVVPMWPAAPPSTDGYHPETVELHLFVPQRDGRHVSRLAEDDGLTFAAHDGACVRTTFTVTRSGRSVSVVGEVEGSGYAEHAREAFELVVHGADPDTVRHDGQDVPPRDGRFRMANAGTGFSVQLEL